MESADNISRWNVDAAKVISYMMRIRGSCYPTTHAGVLGCFTCCCSCTTKLMACRKTRLLVVSVLVSLRWAIDMS